MDKEEDRFETQEGIILYTPKSKMDKIIKGLQEEIKFVKNSKIIVKNKKEILSLLEVALSDAPIFPNRKLRFYIDKNRGCPRDVNLDSQKLTEKEQYLFYRYNPRQRS
jgi:hypothetical protein